MERARISGYTVRLSSAPRIKTMQKRLLNQGIVILLVHVEVVKSFNKQDRHQSGESSMF